jgi:hypothetical protein
MKRQSSFADSEYAGRRKATRREVFLCELDRLVPWAALMALIEPHYYKGARAPAGGAGADASDVSVPELPGAVR